MDVNSRILAMSNSSLPYTTLGSHANDALLRSLSCKNGSLLDFLYTLNVLTYLGYSNKNGIYSHTDSIGIFIDGKHEGYSLRFPGDFIKSVAALVSCIVEYYWPRYDKEVFLQHIRWKSISRRNFVNQVVTFRPQDALMRCFPTARDRIEFNKSYKVGEFFDQYVFSPLVTSSYRDEQTVRELIFEASVDIRQ
jgi:hypothetical protein